MAGIPNSEALKDLFTYHPPEGDQAEKYKAINDAAFKLALAIFQNTPSCPDQSVAIRTVREARMWANSAIANQGRG